VHDYVNLGTLVIAERSEATNLDDGSAILHELAFALYICVCVRTSVTLYRRTP